MPCFVFYSFFLPSLFTNYKKERGERKNKETKKRILEAWQSFDNTSPVPLKRSRLDESNDIKKCHQWWLECVTRAVWRQMSPETFWSARVAHYDHRSWPSLMLLDSSRWYLSNSTNDVIVEISVYLRDLFLFFSLFFSLSSLFIVNRVNLFLEFKKVADEVTSVICDSLNYATFLNIFYTVLFYFIF